MTGLMIKGSLFALVSCDGLSILQYYTRTVIHIEYTDLT